MDSLSRRINITDDQVSEIEKGNGFNADDIKGIQEARSKITQEIELSTELKLSKKKDLIQRLNKETSSTDISTILKFRDTVNKEISNSLDENYEKRILDQKDVFSVDKDRGLDTAKDYITQFKALSIEEKRDWMAKLDQEIEERITLREQIKDELPEIDEQDLRKLRRSEMRKRVDNLKTIKKIFERDGKYFSSDEQKKLKARIADSDETDQEDLIKEAEESLEERKDFEKIYKSLPKEFITAAGNFAEQSFEEKERSLEKVREEMKKAFKGKFLKAREAGYVSQISEDEAYDYFKNADMLGKYGMIEAWNKLDGQLQEEHKLKDKFDKIMKELGKLLTPNEIAKFEHDFQMSSYLKKEGHLLPKLEELLKEKTMEKDDESKRTQDYTNGLKEANAKGYISKGTMELSLKLWKNGDEKYRNNTFDEKHPDIFKKKLEPYKEVYNDFQSSIAQIKTLKIMTPAAIAAKTLDFTQGGLTKRGQIVLELHETLKSATGKTADTKIPAQRKQEEFEDTETEAEKQIARLTMTAGQAERKREFEKAYDIYLEILDLDPSDQLARRNAAHMRSLIDQNDNEDESQSTPNSEEKAKLTSFIKQTEKHQDIRSQMEEKTILETFADETAGSEAVGKSTKAINRSHKTSDFDRELAEKLAKDGYQLQEDGTATEIITINKDEKLTAENKHKLSTTAKEEIIRSSDPRYMQNIQFKDRNGQEVGAKEAFTAIDQKDEKIRKTILERTLAKGLHQRLGSTKHLSSIIEEELEKDDRKVDLAA